MFIENYYERKANYRPEDLALQSRERLDQTKFFYSKMNEEFNNPRIFDYYLNAFLASGRSVTNLFEKEFSDNSKLMGFHEDRMKVWHEDKVMRLLYELRSVSLKECTPPTRKTVTKSFSTNFTIADSCRVIKTSPDGKQETRGYDQKPPAPPDGIPAIVSEPSQTDGVVKYAFENVPRWFDQDKDVMKLSEEYLLKLIEYVEEAEKLLST